MIPYVLGFIAGACLLLGTLVILQDYKRLTNVIFAGICLCFSVWAIAILVFLQTTDVHQAYYAAKFDYIAAASFASLLLVFALQFPRASLKRPVWIWLILIAGIAVSVCIAVIEHFVIAQTVVVSGANRVVPDPSTYLFYATYFVVFFCSALAIAIVKSYRLGANERIQSRLYAAGILINGIPGVITNLYLPYFNDYRLIWIGPALSIFFLSFTAYAIIRHSLFDIRLAAVRGLAYVLTLGALTVVYYAFAYVLSLTILGGGTAVSFNPLNIVLALILAFLFQPIKRFFDRITGRLFFRNVYDSEEFFGLLSSVLSTTSDLRDLLMRASSVISMTFKSRNTFFVIQSPTSKNRYVIAPSPRHDRLTRDEIRKLDVLARARRGSIIVADAHGRNGAVRRQLAKHEISLLLPLWHDGEPIGYLAIGEALGPRYTSRDFRVLEAIADELVIAIQNAQAVEEVRQVNATLQQRIDSATRDLRSKNDRLKELDNTKDEFISMASHQLRTPLTSVKGYVSMILDGDAGPITDQQRRFLSEAFDSSTRMVGIIGDFLNVSRLQTGKFMLEKTEINLADIAEAEVEHLQNTAQMRNLKIRYKKPAHFPAVIADKSKIEQVMMNFMDNALFYAPNSKTVEVELAHDGGKAIFTVRDHGIGVPKSEQANLFTKFFRATNARKQRPDGTGVGIFLAKKVVTAHHGDIIFESEEGQGSTFGFTLPLKK